MTIYDIVGNDLQLKEMMESEEISPETFKDMIELNEMDLAEKLNGYGKVIKELSYESEALKKEADRLYNNSEVLAKNVKRMKETIMFALQTMNKPKVKTELFSFSVSNNAPSLKLREGITWADVPEQYLIMQDPKIDTGKIKEELKNGNVVDFATLEVGQSLRMR